MDREGADYFGAVKSISERLGATCAIVHLPIGTGSNFRGMIDVVDKAVITWASSDPVSMTLAALADAELSAELIAGGNCTQTTHRAAR